mmetsp:Transcript_42370/g.103829  ORF Transcript_42370/g.103829 Transcript_42370/m.103829 type:complete len:319 (+) Transcript_42370:144-1100(+)
MGGANPVFRGRFGGGGGVELLATGVFLMLVVPVKPFSAPWALSRSPFSSCSSTSSGPSKGFPRIRMGVAEKKDLEKDLVSDVRTTFSRSGAEPVDMAQLIHRGPGALKTLYHSSSRVLCVFFFKKDCSICHVFQPILERVVKEYQPSESLHFVDLEVSENPVITKEAGVTAVPGVHVYFEGQLIDVHRGVHCKRFLRNAFDNLVASHGSSASAKRWAEDRLAEARKERFFSSDIYTSVLESQHEHFQQYREIAWSASNIVRSSTHLGLSATLASALQSQDEEAELNKLRTMLPAFHMLANVTPEPAECIGHSYLDSEP